MDWKSIIKTVAPWIGTALGGPLGGLAIGAVADCFGLSEKTEESIKQVLSGATPEQMLMLKQADQAFALHMRDMGFKNVQALEKIAADDRANAREREIRTGDSWTPRLLAGLVVIGWLFVQWFLLNHIIDQQMRELIARVLGTLDGALMLVLSYYFGSSASSREKNVMLAQQAEK